MSSSSASPNCPYNSLFEWENKSSVRYRLFDGYTPITSINFSFGILSGEKIIFDVSISFTLLDFPIISIASLYFE